MEVWTLATLTAFAAMNGNARKPAFLPWPYCEVDMALAEVADYRRIGPSFVKTFQRFERKNGEISSARGRFATLPANSHLS